MKSVSINATEREDLGSKFARKLRKEGNVPCVVYGSEQPLHFYAPVLEFRDLVYTSVAKIASINVNGKTIEAVMQDIQFAKMVTLEVPVFLTGSARGVLSGGKLKHTLRKLSVRALPANLPDSISLDIAPLRIGQSIRVSDVPTPNFEILNLGKAVICSIAAARGAVAEADEAEGEDAEAGSDAAETAE